MIGDLGHAKALEKNSITNESNRSFGTNNYLAPETNEQKITTKIDIWFV